VREGVQIKLLAVDAKLYIFAACRSRHQGTRDENDPVLLWQYYIQLVVAERLPRT
jgi:hypothetical protein